MKILNKSTLTLLVSVLGAIGISSCGGGSNGHNGGSSSNTSSNANVVLSAPAQVPVGLTTFPVVVHNVESTIQSGLTYELQYNGTGTSITVDPITAKNCETLESDSYCQVNVNVGSNATPGAVTLAVQKSMYASALTKKLSNIFTSGSKSTSSVMVGFTNSPVPNSESGFAGVTLYYPQVVTLPDNGAGVVNISLLVNSNNQSSYNTFDLVDRGYNSLDPLVLTGNSGPSASGFTSGTFVSAALSIAPGANTVSFIPTLKGRNGLVTYDTPIQITVLRPNSNSLSAIQVIPNLFSLNESYSSQVITVVNTGNAQVTGLRASTLQLPLSINSAKSTCGATLGIGASCTEVVDLNVNSEQSGSSNISMTYDSTGGEISSQNSTFTFKGKFARASLSISSVSNPNFDFFGTTASPSKSSVATITNDGTVPEQLISIPQANKFTIVGGNYVTNGCNPGVWLNPGESCAVNITYSNPLASQSSTTANISFDYMYSFGDEVYLNGSSTVGLTYQTQQAQASLIIQPSLVNFGTVSNNGFDLSQPQIVTISNTGLVPAVNVVPTLTGSSIYAVNSTSCGSTVSPGESCVITLIAGPVPSTTLPGTLTGSLNVTYTPYVRATTSNTTYSALSAQVVAAHSAVIQVTQTSNTFAGGAGTLANPFMLPVDSSATVSYTLTNIGNSDASDFNIVPNAGALSPWVLQNQCTYLPADGGTCTVTITLPSQSAAGAALLLQNVIDMTWHDSASPNGRSQPMLNSDLYASVYSPATVAVTPTTGNVTVGVSSTNLTITVNLSGGYNVGAQTVIVDTSSARGNVVATPSSCVVSSTEPSCSMVVSANAMPSIGSGNYTFPITVTGGAIAATASIAVNTSAPQWISESSVYSSTNAGYSTNSPCNSNHTCPYLDTNLIAAGPAGNPYIAYRINNGGLSDAVVYKYESTTNTLIDINNTSLSSLIGSNGSFKSNTSALAINPITGNPFLFYATLDPPATEYLSYYNGSSWANYGGAFPSSSSSSDIYAVAATFDTLGNPYVAVSNHTSGLVIYSNTTGPSGGWVASNALTPDEVSSISLGVSGNTLYIAYQKAQDNSIAIDSCALPGCTNIQPVDSAFSMIGVTNGNISLAVNNNGVPYVAFVAPNIDNSGPFVLFLSGGVWQAAGSQSLPNTNISNINLVINPVTNEPYISFVRGSTPGSWGTSVSVLKYNGTTWNAVGPNNMTGELNPSVTSAPITITSAGLQYMFANLNTAQGGSGSGTKYGGFYYFPY